MGTVFFVSTICLLALQLFSEREDAPKVSLEEMERNLDKESARLDREIERLLSEHRKLCR